MSACVSACVRVHMSKNINASNWDWWGPGRWVRVRVRVSVGSRVRVRVRVASRRWIRSESSRLGLGGLGLMFNASSWDW